MNSFEHLAAMMAADEASMWRRKGDSDLAKQKFREALESERTAAFNENANPWRGILLRSAACLALDAEEWAEAERLAACVIADPGTAPRQKQQAREVMAAAQSHMTLIPEEP